MYIEINNVALETVLNHILFFFLECVADDNSHI